jgi:hypothetical protein
MSRSPASKEPASLPHKAPYRAIGARRVAVMANQAHSLRKAIENLINAKLHDALAKPGGLDRLIAHRVTGVASWEIRNAEKQLDQALSDILEHETQDSEALAS